MRRTKAEAAETRQQILAAAEELFLREGVTHSTLDQIAAAANVTRGAIYWHFKDKYVLFEALYEEAELPQEEIASKALDEGGSPLQVLEDCLVDCIRTVGDDPRRQRICMIMMNRCEYVGPLLKVLARCRESSERMHDVFRRGFRMAREQGTLDARWEPDVAARILNCTAMGIFTEWLGWDTPSGSPDEYVQTVRDLFVAFRSTTA